MPEQTLSPVHAVDDVVVTFLTDDPEPGCDCTDCTAVGTHVLIAPGLPCSGTHLSCNEHARSLGAWLRHAAAFARGTSLYCPKHSGDRIFAVDLTKCRFVPRGSA